MFVTIRAQLAPPCEPFTTAVDLLGLDAPSLARCMAALAERERAVLLFTFFEDQSAAEIADALGMQPGHVRVTRNRALHRLRDCMGVGAEP